jgi:hypothetical protein
MARAKKVRARSSFGAVVDGRERLVHQGEEFPANHPAVKGRQELFAEVGEGDKPKPKTTRQRARG